MTALQILNQWNEKLMAFRIATGKTPTVCVLGKTDFGELSAAIGICYGTELRHLSNPTHAFGPGQYQLMGVSIYVSSVECGYFFGMEPSQL